MNSIQRDRIIFVKAQNDLKETKEQNKKMYEALKKVYAEYGDPKNYDFLESFLKEIES